MTLIVEDGTGILNSESYIGVADADTYWAARGNDLWAPLTDTEKEEALRRGTDYMVANFRFRWAGYRQFLAQALDWPRVYVPVTDISFGYGPYPTYVPFGTVPEAVKQACAEIAYRAAAGELDEDLEQGLKSAKIGPIQVDYDTSSNRQKFYSAVYNRISQFLVGQGQRVSLVRT